ncbi:hypothetical protein HDU76_007044, partial [Blyttiomyces sp. JEL0837]
MHFTTLEKITTVVGAAITLLQNNIAVDASPLGFKYNLAATNPLQKGGPSNTFVNPQKGPGIGNKNTV